MKIHPLCFFTEYYQFYLLDASTKSTTDADDFWCAEATPRRLAIGEGLEWVICKTNRMTHRWPSAFQKRL